ncbi:hypothetical protein F5Y08DRAFT_344650 [Xylaria arbuscula]|nr:hypothetical protein F5Y08DRAFT_344650 [Xylaria arbuscula]
MRLDRTHILMNKFQGPDDPGYSTVAGTVETLLQKVRKGWPIEIANAWIRTTRYSLKELEIERLSGDRLPMNRCYINLAIVKQVKTLKEGIEIKLPALFEPRETPNGQQRPSRILIRGRAGVGKSTLCKKIVYELIHGTNSILVGLVSADKLDMNKADIM